MTPRIAGRAGRALLALVVFACAALAGGCEKDPSWQVGATAPRISALDLNDATVNLSDFRGRVLVVRFWASGCRACVAGMPALDRYRARYADADLAVVAVNMGDSREAVATFVKDLKLSYPVLRDPALIAARKYAVRSTPTTFFIDRNGIAGKMVQGEVPEELFHRTVRDLLRRDGRRGPADGSTNSL